MSFSVRVSAGPGPAGARAPTPGRHRQLLLLPMLLFPAVIAALVAVMSVGVTLWSGIRAYAGGDALRSPGRQAAVHRLYRFAATRDGAEYERYIAGLTVPTADRRARLELQPPNPDVPYAVRSFIEGKSRPANAKDITVLFRYFGDVSYLRRAVEIWTAGDAKLDTLDREARQLHELVRSGVTDPARYREVLGRIDRIDQALAALDAELSTTLRAGARWLRRVVLAAVMLAGAVLAWAGVAIWRRLVRPARAARPREPRPGRAEPGGGPVRRAPRRRYGTMARMAAWLRRAGPRAPADGYGARRAVIQRSRSPNTSSRPTSARRAW